MFVVKNTKRSYNCYLNEENKWKGLLEAKIFSTKEEAEKNAGEQGMVISWSEIRSTFE